MTGWEILLALALGAVGLVGLFGLGVLLWDTANGPRIPPPGP